MGVNPTTRADLVVPAADTQLTAEAVTGGAVVRAAAVLPGEKTSRNGGWLRRNTDDHPPLQPPDQGSHLQVGDVPVYVHRGGFAVFRDIFVVRGAAFVVHCIHTGDGHVLVALRDVTATAIQAREATQLGGFC